MTPLYRITKLKAEPHRADDFHDDIEGHPNASEAAVLIAKPTGEVKFRRKFMLRTMKASIYNGTKFYDEIILSILFSYSK